MAISAPRDDNRVPSLVSVSNADGVTPVLPWTDPNTHRLLVDSNAGAGSGATMVVVTNGTIVVSTGTIVVASGTVNIVTGGTPLSTSGTVAVSGGTINVKVEDGSGTPITSTGGALDVNIKTSSISTVVSGTVSVANGTINVAALPAISGAVNVGGTVIVQTGTIVVNSGTVNVATLPPLNLASGTININTGTINVRNEDGAGTPLTSTGAALDVNIKSVSVAQTINGTVTVSNGTIVVSAGTVNVASVVGSGSTGAVVPAQADYIGANVSGTLFGLSGANPSGTIYALRSDITSINGTTVGSTAAPTNTNAMFVSVVSGTTTVSGNITVTTGSLTVNSGTVNVAALPALNLASGTININTGTVNVRNEDGSGNPITSTGGALDVNIKDGTSGTVIVNSGTVNVAASVGSGSTGAVVPSAADYQGINVAGTLFGWTGKNPSGTLYAASVDVASVVGVTAATAASGILKVGIADGSGTALTSTGAALDVNIKTSSVSTVVSGTVTVANGTVNIVTTGTPLNVLVNSGTVAVSTGTVVVNAGTINIAAAAGTGNTNAVVPTAADYQGINVSGTLFGWTGKNPTGTIYAASVDLTSANGTLLGTTAAPTNTNAIFVSTVSGTTTVSGNITVTTGSLSVNTGTIVVNAGTVNIAALPALNLASGTININTGTIAAIGNIASGAADSGAPVKIGAVGHTAAPTAVTDGQRVNLIADKVGKLIAVGAIRDLKAIQTTSIYNSIGTVAIITAGATGVFNDIYGLTLANRAGTVNVVTLTDSPNGTARFLLEIPAQDTRGFMLAVDSAVPQGTSAATWYAQCSTSGSIEVTALYVKNI